MAMTTTLAYHDTATITAVKSFIVQPPGSKSFSFTAIATKKARVFFWDKFIQFSLIV
jgi:hypothetical protein